MSKSVFGSTTDATKPPRDIEVFKTGGEVDSIILSLIPHSYDKDESVRSTIAYAIVEMGTKQMTLVVSSLMTFLYKNSSKASYEHRLQLLELLERILNLKRDEIDNELVHPLITYLTKEMTNEVNEPHPDCSQVCSSCLVICSSSYCNVVVESLLSQFKHGEAPHYYITKTLADVAVANSIEFTLRLKEILSRTIPCLGTIKKVPTRWVFATALGRYAEALQSFLSNADEERRKEVNPSAFELDMLSGFDIIFNQWIAAPEIKIRVTCAESLGHMCSCIERSSFENRLPKVVLKYLELYKKEKPSDHLPITTGFSLILTEAVKTRVLESSMNTILTAVHPMLCRPPPPMTDANSFKNYNELLRMTEILARADVDTTINFVVNRFQLKDREIKIGSLVILRHLVNSMDPELDQKRPLIMSTVISLISETDLVLRKAIMQLIVSMGNQNYLTMEGGQTLLKFLLQQSALHVENEEKDKKAAAEGATTPLQLRNAAQHILVVLASKVVSSRDVMWPYFLEFVNSDPYDRAIYVIFRCIEVIGNTKREENASNYNLNFELLVNLPSPHSIIARLLVLAAEPHRKPEAGVIICRAMLALGMTLHPQVGTYWDESIPTLIEYLESQNAETLNLSKWRDTLLKFFRETINVIDAAKFLNDLLDALVAQFKLYKNDSSLHRVIHRYIGALLAKIESRTHIQNALDVQMATINHKSDEERQGFAQSMGMAASAHLDIILPKLTEKVGKPSTKEKKGGFFSSFSNKDEGLDEYSASTYILSYGYVAAYANVDLLSSRVEVHILHNLLPLLPKARSNLFRLNLVKAIEFIGKAIHPSRLPEDKKSYKLPQRDELILGLLSYLDDKGSKKDKENAITFDVRVLSLNALSTLIRLDPPVSTDISDKILTTILPNFAFLEKDCKLEDSTKELIGKKEEASINSLLTPLNNVLLSMVAMNPTVASVIDNLKHFEKYLNSTNELERERSSASLLAVLKEFITVTIGPPRATHKESTFPQLGLFLALLLPRICDSLPPVRTNAVESIQALLFIDQLLANPDNPKPSSDLKLLTEIRARADLSKNDYLPASSDLASLLLHLLPLNTITSMMHALFNGLTDNDSEASYGAAHVLQTCFDQKTLLLNKEISSFVTEFLHSFTVIQHDETLKLTLASLCIFTKPHFQTVIAQLLDVKLPIPPANVKALNAIMLDLPTFSNGDASSVTIDSDAQNASNPLAVRTLLYLCDVINNTPVEKDTSGSHVVVVSNALKEILKQKEIALLITNQFAMVYCTLMLRIGTAHDEDKDAVKEAANALKELIENQSETDILATLEEEKAWDTLSVKKTFDDGITTIATTTLSKYPERKRPLLTYLAKFFSQQSFTGQRIVASAMLAEFVNHCGDDKDFLRDVIKYLLPRVADKLDKVRKHSLRGLGNLVTIWCDETAVMAASILSSLMSAAEDSDDEVAAEAVSSLTRIATVVNPDTIQPMLISICFRLRPAFDRKESGVRAAAFTLFGALCRFGRSTGGNGSDDENFMEQLHANLPIYIVHLYDENENVRVACHLGFCQLTKLLHESVIQVVDDTANHSYLSEQLYEDLLLRLTPLLTEHYSDRLRGFIETTSGYFTSNWKILRGNAAFFASLLISNSGEKSRRTVAIGGLVSSLIQLLDETDANVRLKTAKGLRYLNDI